jgi:hypothetical protein
MTSSERQNRLHAHAATALHGAPSADDGNADARDLLPINQRRVSATGTDMSKPAGAVSSVFDIGVKAKRKRAPTSAPPINAQIVSGVPIPPAVRDKGRSDVYGDLLGRMNNGDMVMLESGQARTMRSRAKKMGIDVTLRVAENNKVGVWRIGMIASSSNA